MEKLSLSLTLIPDKRKVRKDNLPNAKVRLKNEGTQVIIVNGRMLLMPAGSPSRVKEMVFSISGPPGSISLKAVTVKAGVAGREHFVRLLPGEFIDKVYELKEYFYYDQPGNYTIEAIYYNETEYEIPGNKSWKGELVSNKEHFEII